MTYIAVIGEGQATPENSILAEAVGRGLAEQGAILVCGGMGGVMEAACRGAKEAGGTTVGILPGNRRSDGNSYLDVAIVTGMGEGRNLIVVKSAQAVIAIGGRYGTLSEIAFALLQDKPVIGLGTWSLTRDGHPDTALIPAANAEEAVALALALAGDSDDYRL